MLELQWKLKAIEQNDTLFEKNGSSKLDKTLLLQEELPAVTLKSVRATIPLKLAKEEKVWINGYQTWTYSPEFGEEGRIRGIHRIPKIAVRKFHLDAYSDYHFVDYPFRKGIVHGFSVMTIRRGEHYTLIGSLGEEKAWTMFQMDRNNHFLTLERDVEGLETKGSFDLFHLFLTEGTEEEVFQAWFEACGLKKPTAKPIAGYSSWYNRYQDISETSIREDLLGCDRILEKGDFFQVDDGWEIAVGDWRLDQKKFPSGMKRMVEEIHSHGYQAGLWLAPFVAETDSIIYKEHKDWFLKHNGEEVPGGCNWSGYYSLDIDNKEVRDYLEATFDTVLNDWGFDLVKLDFLYCAAPYGTKEETRSGRMYRAMKFLRRICGDKLILGCGVPTAAGFGLTDYSRVSCDVTLDEDDKLHMRLIHRERPSTRRALETSFYRRCFALGAYLTDPDVFFLRTDNIKLTEEQKLHLGTVSALHQGVFFTSDNPALYTEKQLAEYKRLRHIWKDAKDIRVTHEGTRTIHYTLDGKKEKVELKF